MGTVTVQEAKEHIRVLDNEEDYVIERFIDAAESHIDGYLSGIPDPMPAPIRAAILLLVGDLYENRERQQTDQLYRNPTFDLLLRPYRDMAVL